MREKDIESNKERDCKKAISEYIAKSIRELLDDDNCIQALTLFDEIVVNAGYWEEKFLYDLGKEILERASEDRFDDKKLEEDEENYFEDTGKEKAWDEKYGKVLWRVKRWVISWNALRKEWLNPTDSW